MVRRFHRPRRQTRQVNDNFLLRMADNYKPHASSDPLDNECARCTFSEQAHKDPRMRKIGCCDNFKQVEMNDLFKNASKDRPDSNYNKKQLEMGIKVEHEHTHNYDVAKNIAKDHLDENPEYYTYLKKMESKFD